MKLLEFWKTGCIGIEKINIAFQPCRTDYGDTEIKTAFVRRELDILGQAHGSEKQERANPGAHE